jgi:hypothetical protein
MLGHSLDYRDIRYISPQARFRGAVLDAWQLTLRLFMEDNAMCDFAYVNFLQEKVRQSLRSSGGGLDAAMIE